MWGIGTAAMTVAVLLAPSPAAPELPEPRPQPFQGCVLPLTSLLTSVVDPCPPDDRDLPPGGCVLPLQDASRGALARDPRGDSLLPPLPERPCPDARPDRSPRFDVFPLDGRAASSRLGR